MNLLIGSIASASALLSLLMAQTASDSAQQAACYNAAPAKQNIVVKESTPVAAGLNFACCAPTTLAKTVASDDSGDPSADGPVNNVCPISGRSVQPNAPVALYQGLEVGFCSRSCPRTWMMQSDTQKRQLIAEVALNPRLKTWGPPPRNPFR